MNQDLRGWLLLAKRWLIIALWALRETLTAGWSIVRAPLLLALQVAAALIVLFEEWGWRPLSDALARLTKFASIAKIERWVASLPPYGALLVFALPVTLLFPLKFVAVWLLSNGRVTAATALFIGAKIVSTAIVARIFTLTKPALMQIAWFARAYTWFVPWKDSFFAAIRASWVWRYGRMVKTRASHEIKRVWAGWKPEIALLTARVRIYAAELVQKLKSALFGAPKG